MTDQLEEIKQKIDIVTLISESVSLKKAGRNFKGLCPFHSEKSPSFIVSPERQIFHCFGCQAGGDIFGFLMKSENLEFVEALGILAKRAGVKLFRNFEASGAAKVKEKIYAMNHLASEFYHYLLLNHPSGKKALDYIRNRGVKPQTLEAFGIGYAPQMWDGLIKFLTKKGYSSQDIELAGLAIKATRHYDRFRGRLMFTLKDVRGNVVGFAGRVLEEAPSTSSGQAKYINTPETPVYTKGNVLYGLDLTKEAIKKEDGAIIVEGELDLISSYQAGVANVVAIKGSALTEGQVNLLKRYTQNLTLALDMDLAGQAAAQRGIEIADRAGFNILVTSLPNGKDPDECARNNPAEWKKAVKDALPVFDYYLNWGVSKYDPQTAEGKKKIGEVVLPIFLTISNPIVQAHYFTKLAHILGVSEEVIQKAGQRLSKNEIFTRSKSSDSILPVENRPQGRLEEYFLAFLLQGHQFLENEKAEDFYEFLTVSPAQKIYKLLKEQIGKKDFQIVDFLKSLPPELNSLADRVYLEDLNSLLEQKKLFLAEFEKIGGLLKRNFYKQKLLELAKKMQIAEDKTEQELLSSDYQKFAKELTKYNR